MSAEINSYGLSRAWFDFCFENPELINPTHTAIYFFAIEHCNRLGWKEKFGFPTQMTMDALGIKKHQTYIKYFNDLVDWGFLKLIERSRNQYSSNIISLISATPKNGKALDKAFITHAAKQTETNGQSTGQSKDSIDKQDNQLTNKQSSNDDRAFFQLVINAFNEVKGGYQKKPQKAILSNQRLRSLRAAHKEFNEHFNGRDFVKACKLIAEYKMKEWSGTDFWKHATPDTLYSRTHFMQYLDQVRSADSKAQEPPKKQDFSYAENMIDMHRDKWEELFRGKLETDNEFRKHFGYAELPTT